MTARALPRSSWFATTLPPRLSPQRRALSTAMPELKRRAVAGSFILKFPDGDLARKPQVALFRRSGKVRTYQHKYAPISGSVEPTDASPLATAWRELAEETSLDSTALRLFRQGKPYAFVDEAVSREWAIHPFAFALSPSASESAIRLDWEHESYAWFDPNDLAASAPDDSFPGVPRLLDSLRRVWFDIDLGPRAGQALRDGLLVLQRDHTSGARQLAAKALDIFADVVRELPAEGVSRDAWWSNVRFAAWHLWKNGRESMGAAVLSAVVSSLSLLEAKLPASAGELPPGFADGAADAVTNFAARERQSSSKISQQFTSFLKQHYPPGGDKRTINILTLSSSSTISSSLGQALAHGDHSLHIRVLESRPLFEGVTMARQLAAAGPPKANNVAVYTDASAGVAAQGVDMVLLGADLIDRRGNVSNKTGSLPAVLAARHVAPGATVVALADKGKVLPFEPPGQQDNGPDEVSRGWDAAGLEGGGSVDVKNVSFEGVDAALIDHYVTEDGVTSSEGIAERADKAKQQADRFFEGL